MGKEVVHISESATTFLFILVKGLICRIDFFLKIYFSFSANFLANMETSKGQRGIL